MLEHTAPVDHDRWDEFGPGAAGVGWDLGLHGLSLHLSSGAVVDIDADADAWLSSDDGRRFVTLSSSRWCEASIASGTPREDARAAAGRTTAFYTAVGGDD